jgi:hypothetical protein
MATIFRKTDKGHAEIETRAHRLSPRLRSALILVDGKRSSDELRGLILQQADETLAALNEQGFIEVVAVAVPAAAPAAAAVARPPAPVAPSPVSPQREFELLKRQLAREFTDLTGPPGEAVAIRIEKTADRKALLALLPTVGECIAATRGSQLGSEFRQRFAARIEAA